MADRSGIHAGDNPIEIARRWMGEARQSEPNDPDAMALATVGADGMPNVRMVLLKEIRDDGFVFFTNYDSQKGQEIAATGKAALVLHWKSLRRQVRVQGEVMRLDAADSDAYYASRSLKSRLGAWASQQSRPLDSRAQLMVDVAKVTARLGTNPARPDHWGGYVIVPSRMELWSDGAYRLHDRFVWECEDKESGARIWSARRLYP